MCPRCGPDHAAADTFQGSARGVRVSIEVLSNNDAGTVLRALSAGIVKRHARWLGLGRSNPMLQGTPPCYVAGSLCLVQGLWAGGLVA
jgi:hypothetical protein